MGKSMKYKKGQGGKNKGGGGSRDNNNNNGGRWRSDRNTALVRENKKFETYYNNLGLLEEEERDAFWAAMRSDLPNSFRFTGSRGHALTVQRSLIERYIPKIVSVEYEGQNVSPPEPVDWYPSKLAWQMTTPKNVIRRFPPFAAFQKFLVSENSVGNITRQEMVSMIPPLFMDIQPGMTVLDLCAAPGSKSAQLIEMVHGGEEARVRKVLERVAQEKGQQLAPSGIEVKAEDDLASSEADYADSGRATGLLVANDKEYRRAQMLVHQTKRLNSPNIIVTNHDATVFPSLRISPPGQSARYLKFDRILADVPCSGDGTTRKNFDVWRNWTYGNALGLHPTQVRILCRALQMLKVGGRVVYSTCSLNPIENEAVIAEAVGLCGGSDFVEMVDTAGMIPQLKRREGVRQWTVFDKTGHPWNSWNEVVQAREDGESTEALEKLTKGLFPPAPEEEIPLHRAIRVYPHLQDTGGFFVCVLEKKTEIKVRSEPARTGFIKKEPTKEEAPISATVDEIKTQAASDAKNISHLKAADSIASDDKTLPNEEMNLVKRGLEADADEEPSAKRVKTEDETGLGTANGEQERKVHYPPPPSNPPNPHKSANADGSSSFTPALDFAPGKRRRTDAPQEEAFKYMQPDHVELESVYDFYDIDERFPRDRFMVRNASGVPAKAIYYTSELARDILIANEGKGIKFVHSGVKMFVKQDTSRDPELCKWRVQNEGLPIIEPWINKRTITLHSRETLHRLLLELFPRVGPPGDADTAERLGEIAVQVQDLSMGCCILRVEPDPTSSEAGFDEHFAVPLWRGIGSVNLMLPKEDRKAMLLRLFDDDSELVDTHRQRQQDRGKEEETSKEEPGDALSDEDDGGVPLPSTQTATVPEAHAKLEADAAAEAVQDAEEAEVQHELDTEKVDRGVKVDPDEDVINKTV